MRYCYISLLVGLLVVTWLQSGVKANSGNVPDECCFEFFRGKIPIDKIDSYLKTRSECPYAGVIFITKKPLRICVKPNADWVKRAMQQIDEQQLRKYVMLYLQTISQEYYAAMRYCYFSLLVGLLVVIWLQPGVMAQNDRGPAECCIKFFRGRIPMYKIDSYLKTRPECPNAGVILITKKSLRLCVEPNANWVKRAMQQIDEQQLRQYK
ncbi:C-C motif chemokine 36.1 [Misgurnus anguillicaudatus]|uniref:C-C motif chemokine 36.1 n=1 Tax=Misgurnus anguillicaudatus TaxID=75329 RepID=UPI003CCF4C81